MDILVRSGIQPAHSFDLYGVVVDANNKSEPAAFERLVAREAALSGRVVSHTAVIHRFAKTGLFKFSGVIFL
jgi:hypothetical protein